MLSWNTLQISPDCIWRLAALTGESLIFAWTLAGLVHILIWGKGAISSTAKSRSNNSWPCKAQKLTGEHARRNTFAAQGAASLEQLEVAGSDRTDDWIKHMATYLFHRVSEIEALLSWQNSTYFDKFELQHHTGLSKVIKSVCIYTSLEGFWKAILKCIQCSNIFLKGVHQVSIMAMSAMSAGRTWLSFWMRPCLLCLKALWHSRLATNPLSELDHFGTSHDSAWFCMMLDVSWRFVRCEKCEKCEKQDRNIKLLDSDWWRLGWPLIGFRSVAEAHEAHEAQSYKARLTQVMGVMVSWSRGMPCLPCLPCLPQHLPHVCLKMFGFSMLQCLEKSIESIDFSFRTFHQFPTIFHCETRETRDTWHILHAMWHCVPLVNL